ncbi:DUF559 domain-containing protein [Nocardioides sp. Iso805N]|uniref:DUF559 domain-containing protein n=1 Tax=Nocardioides sp. Iso805N TaxID=1283287 RepID=UPI00037167AC|nr:DUF559 domain-containing protein [Nocardioides sp. Iso805N]
MTEMEHDSLGEPFRTCDLTRIGLTRHGLVEGVADGSLRRIVAGVAIGAHVADSIELRAAAVALVLGSDHIVCDRTAAWLHGVDTLLYQEHEILPAVEVCALRGHEPSVRSGVDGRTRDLAPEDVMIVHGVQVTTPLRTALDLGCHLRRREAYAALNAFARLHELDPADLETEILRFRRRRGVRQLRQLVRLVDPRIESARESWTYLAIHDAGLPLPEPQVWIEVGGVPTYRLDFGYRLSKVCVEYDGVDFHDMTAEQRAYDEERRAWLRDRGWTVIVVRTGDFTGAALETWLGCLRRALAPAYRNRRF